MENLFAGVKEFNAKDFNEHKELFEELGSKQQPHTLFIGCTDSRLVPNLITSTLPGELFVVRNIANIVPIHRCSNDYLATTSAIEYAVQVLNVKNIVVCGHSNCGGCGALYMDESQLKNIPHTRKWLELAGSVKERVLKNPETKLDLNKRAWMTEQMNVVEQVKHLLSYPYIKEKFIKKEINLLGWYYIIGTGEVFNYNTETMLFEKIQ